MSLFKKVYKALKCARLNPVYLQNFIDQRVDDSTVNLYLVADELERVIPQKCDRVNFFSAFQNHKHQLSKKSSNPAQDWDVVNLEDLRDVKPSHDVQSSCSSSDTEAANETKAALDNAAKEPLRESTSFKDQAQSDKKVGSNSNEELKPKSESKDEHEPWELRWLEALSSGAKSLFHQQKYTEVLRLCELLCPLQNNILGEEDPATLKTLQMKAGCFRSLQQYNDALDLHTFVYEKRSQILGPNHRDTLHAQRNVAQVLAKQGRLLDAMHKLEEVCEIQKLIPNVGPDHPNTLKTQVQLAHCVGCLNKYEKSLELYSIVFEKRRQISGLDSKYTIEAQQGVAWALAMLGRHSEALESYEKIYENQVDLLGEDHPDNLRIKTDIETITKQLAPQ